MWRNLRDQGHSSEFLYNENLKFISIFSIEKLKSHLIFSKNDINNNSAKTRRTPETNDDDDVETAKTADTETLVPGKLLNGTNNHHHQQLDEDYPSDPNETDQVS